MLIATSSALFVNIHTHIDTQTHTVGLSAVGFFLSAYCCVSSNQETHTSAQPPFSPLPHDSSLSLFFSLSAHSLSLIPPSFPLSLSLFFSPVLLTLFVLQRVFSHTRIHTQIHTHTHTHTHQYTHIYTHTHTHTDTHINTHTNSTETHRMKT